MKKIFGMVLLTMLLMSATDYSNTLEIDCIDKNQENEIQVDCYDIALRAMEMADDKDIPIDYIGCIGDVTLYRCSNDLRMDYGECF